MYNELQAARQGFLSEAQELLATMEGGLLHLQHYPGDRQAIDSIFRAARSIKRIAGVFGFEPLVNFSRVVVALLDKVLENEIVINRSMITLLRRSGEHLWALINEQIKAEQASSSSLIVTASSELIGQLNGAMQTESSVTSVEPATALEPVAQATDNQWAISLHFGRDAFKAGMDPSSFINYLRQVGNITKLSVLSDRVPSLEELDPESCYLGLQVTLATPCSKEQIEAVFEFIAKDGEIVLAPLGE